MPSSRETGGLYVGSSDRKREPTAMSASPAIDRGDELLHLAGIVLAVPVEPDGEVEAVLERVAEARLHGAADTEVERQAYDARSGGRRDGRRLVRRAVVHDQHLEVRLQHAHLAHDVRDGVGLVLRRHDREAAQPRGPARGRIGGAQHVQLGTNRHAGRIGLLCKNSFSF